MKTLWVTILKLYACYSQLKYKGYANFWKITNTDIEKSKGDS